MHKILMTLIASAVVVAGCSTSAASSQASISSVTAPDAMTSLAPPTSVVPDTTAQPADTDPPTIETDPASGDVIDWYHGDVIITTEPGATVLVNGEPADLATDGSFTFTVTNTPGDNIIEVSAIDEAGNTTDESIVYEFSPPPTWIAALGDSVMLGAKQEIEDRIWSGIVDASVSRQFLDAPKAVADLMAQPEPPQVILIGLGTNGAIQKRHFDEVMEEAGPGTQVVFVNVRVPRDWEAESNAQLLEGTERYENATLVDWFGIADERDELFAGDGFHPSIAGRIVLADLIAEAINPGSEQAESQ